MNLTDEEKRKLLEIKEDDDEYIKSMKTEFLMVMDMTPEERKVFYQEQAVADDEHHLQWMIESNKRDDEFIAYATKNARKYANDIEMVGEEEAWVTAAEQWIEIARGTKQNKYTIADIRKQRERIQWQKNQLKKLTSQPIEPKPSSSHSKI